MTTKVSATQFVKHAREFDSAVKKAVAATVMERAETLVDEVYNHFGGYECTEGEATELAKEIVQPLKDAGKAHGPRQTEWKDFVMASVNCQFIETLEYAEENAPGWLDRVNMFRLAKKRWKDAPTSHARALKLAQASGGGNAKAKTPDQKIGMGLGVIKNIKARKGSKIAQLQAKIEAACKELGIKY